MSLHFKVLQGKGGKGKKRIKNNAYADKPLYFITGLMALRLFDWRQYLWFILSHFSAPSVKRGRWGSPACALGHQAPPMAPGDVLALPAAARPCQEPPTCNQVPRPSQGTRFSSKICLEPTGTASHEAGEPWGSATAALCAIRTKPGITASYCMPI